MHVHSARLCGQRQGRGAQASAAGGGRQRGGAGPRPTARWQRAPDSDSPSERAPSVRAAATVRGLRFRHECRHVRASAARSCLAKFLEHTATGRTGPFPVLSSFERTSLECRAWVAVVPSQAAGEARIGARIGQLIA